MYSGDEIYGDEITSGLYLQEKNTEDESEGLADDVDEDEDLDDVDEDEEESDEELSGDDEKDVESPDTQGTE